MPRIDPSRFFALSIALAAACSPAPAEPPATAAVSVPAEPPPEPEPEPPAATVEPAVSGDAGAEGGAIADDGSENRPTGITGSLEPPLVVKQIRAAAPALRACYTAELAKTPDFEANLLLELTIRGAKVVSVDFLRSSASPQFDVCIDKALRTLSFPVGPDGGDTVARLPLHFKAT